MTVKSDVSVGTTDAPPLRVSDAQLANAAREAKLALANGWWEARYELDIDRPTNEGRR